jgi:hypothetical protein
MWQSQVLPVLRSNDLLGIVDGTEPCPPRSLTNEQGQSSVNPEYTIWNKKDQFILSWINATLSEAVLATVYGLNTSRQVWSALASRFTSQSRSRISHIKRQLQNLKQGSMACSDYLRTAKVWADQLAAVGRPIDDEDLISYIIGGLSPIFNSFITSYTFITRENPLNFEDFRDELLNHEMLLNQQNAAATDSSAIALFTQRTGTKPPHQLNLKGKLPQQFNNRFPSRGPNPRFNTNGFSGDSIPPYRQKSNMPFNRSPNFHIGESSNHTAANPVESNLSKPPRTPCQICGKTSHQALDCFHMMDFTYQGRHPPSQLAAMAAQTNAVSEDPEWFANSGANAHITNNLNNLTIQQPFEGNDTVEVGNGSGLTIDNVGSALLHTPNSVFHLNKLLHCPNASANLISIQRFCVDNHCYFILTATHFFVKDMLTKATLLEGKTENGLYPLRFKGSSLKARRAAVALLGIKTSSLIWHFRLGHPSNDVVSRVVKSFKLPVMHSNSDSNKIIICDSCQLGKGKRQPFSTSNRQTLTPLSLIHSDIWTSPITSISGYKYYVVFIDDHSRYTWFYPLKAKSEIYECFVKFKLLVEKQFSTSIKQFQSDGGGEYTSSFFQSFLTKNGIIHRKSCPYTSQQNDLAERKLRHILETGLTLLAHSHLSNRYWVDAFLTSVYLINRLPTPTLENESPFSKLHQKEPNYQQLKVFGCKCYPLLRPLGLHKLEFRSKPCIFLGYCHAGYKCLDPLTNKVYLSRHVVFDELTFPAKDEVPSQLPSQVNATGDLPFILPVSLPSTDLNHDSLPSSADALTHSDSVLPLPDAPCSPNPSTDISTTHTCLDAPPNSPLPEYGSSHQHTNSTSQSPPTQDSSSSNIRESPSPSLPLPIIHPMTTRTRTGSLKPKTFPDFQLYHTIRHPFKSFHTILQESEPSSFRKAIGDPRWQQAMAAEFQALISNGT